MKSDGIREKYRLNKGISAEIATMSATQATGQVVCVSGLCVTVRGIASLLVIGDRVTLCPLGHQDVLAEVVGFSHDGARLMVFGAVDGIGPGTPATLHTVTGRDRSGLAIHEGWLGRVIDPLGRPLDAAGPIVPGPNMQPLRPSPPGPIERARLGPRMDLGVRVLDVFTTCRVGQRLGLFAGSGVGKSSLMSMLARQAKCDVAVIALVGERGREVREFIEDDLGPEGMARSVVVVATSDSPPLMRREAAYAALSVAEYFRDQNKSVLLLMDSVTRFCLALREIGLSSGEPPATKGYPPSVFAELPRLLERAGPGRRDENGNAGHITALFTVLVEGGDHDEPVADAVRGILDGHVVMDRRIGEEGRYPAVDVLKSLSRTVPGCLSAEEAALTRLARQCLATHENMADMIRLGAYKPGTDPAVDEAVRVYPALNAMLSQGKHETSTIESGFGVLRDALSDNAGALAA
jgi:flagellum-specific ATP synthase